MRQKWGGTGLRKIGKGGGNGMGESCQTGVERTGLRIIGRGCHVKGK